MRVRVKNGLMCRSDEKIDVLERDSEKILDPAAERACLVGVVSKAVACWAVCVRVTRLTA